MTTALRRRLQKPSRGFCSSRHVVLIAVLLLFMLPLQEENKWLFMSTNEGAPKEHGGDTTLTASNRDDSLVAKKKPPHTASCHDYTGILHIEHGDYWAAGTAVFFVYVVNYLLYAEEYNLLPWIYFDDFSERIYDADVHGAPSQSFTIPSRLQVTYDCGHDQICQPKQVSAKRKNETISVHGNGVWESYFQPVSDFTPLQREENPCNYSDLPYLTFSEDDMGRMHYGWIKSVRAWHYIESVRPKPKLGHLHEWYGPMRERGARIVDKYYRPKPWLDKAIDKANPNSSKCLAMHVRYTDKSGGREMITVGDYRPYVIQYSKSVPDGVIYLASDSSKTMKQIKRTWPKDVVKRIVMQPSVLHSHNETAVFDIGQHHRTNSEVLTDVYAMAKCNVFLHGHSSVSESVMYVNLKLHNCSVDLEDPDRPTVKEFKRMVGGEHAKCR